MHNFGLAIFLFGNTGGLYEVPHINILAYFQDDCLTGSVCTYAGIYEYVR